MGTVPARETGLPVETCVCINAVGDPVIDTANKESKAKNEADVRFDNFSTTSGRAA